jgi:metal-responsive CopG/Arc/MetJ family transcriptional regulator
MEGEKMAYSDKIYKKEKLISRTFYIDEKLYLELERLSKEVYEASISKLINVAIEELVEKEKIEVYENRNRTCVTRSILIRESLLKGLSELKIKYGLSISMLVNIAVKNEIMEEQKYNITLVN